MDITRRLKYPYIWIDSLCIQQDSPEDWSDQAAKMAAIYMNADATIAALAAEDSEGGLYTHNRNLLSYWPCVLPTSVPLTAWYGRIWPFHNERLTTAPLLLRGWVLQERCLGPRTIYFGKFGVYWECATLRADELFPAGFAEDSLGPTGQGLSQGEIMAKSLLNRRLRLVGTDTIGFPLYVKVTDATPFPYRIFAKFIGYWYQIVERYTESQLSFGKDKLVAIGGILQLVHRRTALTPFAGLWLEFLLDDMLWRTVRPDEVSKPTEYQAPSFSWASITGAVQRKLDLFSCSSQSGYKENIWEPHDEDGHAKRYLAELLATEIHPVDPNMPHAQVKSAHIELRCYTKVFETELWKPAHTPFLSEWTHPYPDLSSSDSDPGGIFSRWFVLDCAADANPGSMTVTCVPLVEWYHPKADHGGRYLWRHVAGVVLVPVSSAGDDGRIYRRVGMFEDCWLTGEERWKEGDLGTIRIV